MWVILKKGMAHRLHEKCCACCKENGFSEKDTCSSIELDKQSNLNCDESYVIILNIFM
jgi:hypothetical protein